MAFSLDPSRNYLSVNEADITHLSRSIQPAIPPDPRFLGHPCQAYICAARENNRPCVSIAILDTATRLPLIFSSSCAAKDEGKLKRLIKEAHAFAGTMGFALEPVNLNYSPAMRQVIIRDLRVMRPPEPHHLPPAPQTNESAPPAEAQAAPSEISVQHSATVPPPPEALPPEAFSSDSELSNQVLLDQIKRLQDENTEAEATFRATIQELTRLLEQVTADNRKLEQTLRQPDESTPTDMPAAAEHAHSPVDPETESLATALKRENELRLEAEAAVATLRDTSDRRQKELEADLLEARADCTAFQEALASEVALRRQLELTGEVTADRLQKELMSVRSEQEHQHAELCRLESELLSAVSDRDRLVEEQEQASAENEAALREERLSATAEREQLTETRRQLELRLEKLAATYEEALIEKELESQRVAAEIKSVTARFEQISAEKKVWDSISANLREKARAVVGKLRKENAELVQEVQRLKKFAATAVTQAPAATSAQEHDSPFAALGLTAQATFQNSSASISGSGADFRHDPVIDVIHYRTADEIIDLYGSANVIQAAPFGRRAQNCNAYICAVQREDGTHMYLAWHLIEESAVLFCLPEKQPCDTGSYARMAQDALYYFESVGFIMNRFELSRESERQLLALEKSGVCRRGPVSALPHETNHDDSICRLGAAA